MLLPSTTTSSHFPPKPDGQAFRKLGEGLQGSACFFAAPGIESRDKVSVETPTQRPTRLASAGFRIGPLLNIL